MEKYELITLGVEKGKVKSFKQMLKLFPFVKLEEEHTPLLTQIEHGLRDVKKMQDSGKKPKTLKEMLDGK